MIKCVKENCDYFNEYGECSITCIHNGYKKVITNYDRIRNMTVEEMANFINKNYKCRKCAYYQNFIKNPYGCSGECQNGIAEWLESEVADNERNKQI